MLDWMFAFLMFLAILFIILSIEYDFGIYWNVIFILTSAMLFYLLAASIMQIEIPWQIFNATSGNVETSYHTFSSPISPYLSYLFMLFGSVIMIYFVAYILGPAVMKKIMR